MPELDLQAIRDRYERAVRLDSDIVWPGMEEYGSLYDFMFESVPLLLEEIERLRAAREVTPEQVEAAKVAWWEVFGYEPDDGLDAFITLSRDLGKREFTTAIRAALEAARDA